MSDRIAVLAEGHVEQVGSPQVIYSAPATASVTGLMGAAAILIRPDSITFQNPGEPIGPLRNVIGGVVTEVAYRGHCTQVHVDVGAGRCG
ncbi:TOBE domain-containing protein [Mycobacterium sp. NPDC048908]|uniref:TOBE domain-containing protein n=1 Tax=Mycobacterium sp. NPDC048908 TaxID=3364292 RepID=UPI0037185A45